MAKTELEEAGESTDGMVESTAKLREEVMALSGVDIMLDKNTFKSTYQVMDELSAKWEELTDIQQASIIELMAGKHQGNVFASLMSNFDVARDALEVSANSAGSAMQEHAKWSESLEARLLKLQATWQSLAQSFMSSDFLKIVLDIVIGLVDAIDKLISNFGLLGTVGLSVMGVGIFKYFKNASNDVKNLAESSTDLTSAATETTEAMTNMASASSEVAESTANVASATTEAVESTSNLASATTETVEASANLASANTEVAESTSNVISATTESAEAMANVTSATTEATESMVNMTSASTEMAEAAGNVVSGTTEFVEAAGNVASISTETAEAVVNVGGSITNVGSFAKKASGGLKAFFSTFVGKVAIIGGVIAAIGLVVNAIKNYKESISEARQETIRSSDDFLDASNSFEQAYIKYSGRTDLTSQEEAELESAIQGTVDALGDKTSALKDIVNSSNDYLESLEAIKEAELDAAYSAAKSKKDNAELELKDVAIGWSSIDGSEVDIDLGSGKMSTEQKEAVKIVKEMESNFISSGKVNGIEKVHLTLSPDADVNEIIDYYNFLVKYQEKLSNEDLIDTQAYEKVSEAIATMSEAISTYTDGVYDAAKAQYQLENGIPKTTEEYLKMREAILKNEDIQNKSFETRKTIADNLDAEYNQLFDLSTAEVQARKFVGLIKGYGDGTKDGTNEIGTVETFLNMRTAVNNNECTVGQYLSELNNVTSMAEKFSDEEKKEFTSSFGLDTDKIKKQYDDINEYISRNYFDNLDTTGMSTQEAESFKNARIKEYQDLINGLTANELAAVINIKSEIDWDNTSTDKILEQIKKEAEFISAMNYTIAIDVETEGVAALNTALTESVSATGLSSSSISALKSRYAELESQGYDLSSMFEETANGIHLNRNAVDELERAYASDKLTETEDNLKVLKGRYDELTEEINNCTDAGERANLYSEQQEVAQKINDLATLASQYEGLTSAYNAWQNAESSGNERDMYENIISGFETVKEELSRGWADDGTIKFLELMTGRTDLAGKSAKELKKIYKDLDKEIKNTGYSVKDFFTTDDDGNTTSTGVYNFLKAVESLEKSDAFKNIKDIDKLIQRDGKGNIISFDFGIAGGDEAIAEALGISEELVQIMKRAADDAGFVVTIDGKWTQLADLKTSAEEAGNALKKLQTEGLKELKDVDLNFDFDVDTVEGYQEQLEKATNALDKFRDKNGKLKTDSNGNLVEGAKEALEIAEYYTAAMDKLTEPQFMQIDTSEVEENLKDPIEKMQTIGELCKKKHLVSLTGDTEDLKDVQDEINKVAKEIEGLDPEIKAQIGIDEDWDAKTIADKIEKGEIEVPAELKVDVQMSEDLKDMRLLMMRQLGLVEDSEVKLKVGYEIDDSTVDKLIKDGKDEVVLEFITKNEKWFDSLSDGNKEIAIELVAKNKDWFDSLEDEEKQVVIKYVSEGNDLDKLTDEEKKVLVKFIGDDSELKDWTPEQKEAMVKYIVDGGDVNDWTPEQKQAFAKYLVDGGDVEGWTPEAKDAFVKYLVDGGDVEGWTPEAKDAFVKYLVDGGDPDKFDPDDKESWVVYKKDSSVPDNYDPKDPEATVTYDKNSKVPDAYDPDKNGTVTFKKDSSAIDKWSPVVSGIAKFTLSMIVPKSIKTALAKIGISIATGTANVDGTAFSNGTATKLKLANKSGKAFKQGDWGVKKTTNALTGELGQELVVYGNRFWTVGDDGAEFANIPKGAIVFNHRQTEEIFKYGKVTSGGGRGRILANGTAFAEGTAFASGSVNKATGEIYKSSSSSSDNDKFTETIDWTETEIERIERAIDNLDQKVNNTYESWSTRNKALTKEISKVEEEIALQQKAYEEYMAAAKGVGLSSSWAKKVREGTVDIQTIEDEVLAEKIQSYQEWYEKALECKDAIADLKETEAELYQQRFDNVAKKFDDIIDSIEHEKAMLEEKIAQYEAKYLNEYRVHDSSDYDNLAKYYQELIAQEEENIAKLQKKKTELTKELKKAVDDGVIKEGSEAWYEMQSEIDDVSLAIEEANTSLIEFSNNLSELSVESFENVAQQFENQLSLIEHEQAILEEKIAQYEAEHLNSHTVHDSSDYKALEKKYNELIAQEEKRLVELEREKVALTKELNEALSKPLDEGGIEEGSEAWYEMKQQINDVELAIEQANTALIEYENTLADLSIESFNNVASQFENQLSVLEFERNMLEEKIAQAEAQGMLVSEEYYKALASQERENIAELQKEKATLLKELDNAMATGRIEEGSEDWYEMCNKIDDVTLAIEESKTALLEYEQTLQQLSWETFDILQDRISQITDEADFLIDLISHKDLYNDSGQLTNEGMAVMGLHGQNYNVYMAQADEYAKEVQRLNQEIAKDPYDQELINRRDELLELQRESILAAEDEKEAIIDMVEEGIELELDALQERIDKYEEALEAEKDLYDYQRKVAEHTKEIASLEKQMIAYEGDDSEEAKAKIQQIKVDLENAKADLEETEYEKYISDTKQLLDTLYDEYELILNQRLDNIDALLADMITEINTNASTISTTISESADSVGYTLSDAMQTIWDANTVKTTDVITMYGDRFSSAQTTTNSALQAINTNIQTMIGQLDAQAKAEAERIKQESATKSEEAKQDAPKPNPVPETPKEEPKKEEPKVEIKPEHQPETPKDETPKKEEPKKEESKKEEPKKDTSTGDGKPAIGDKVKFVSGKYYYDSEGTKPIGSKNQGKEVYITNINNRSWATHPYHISTGKKLGSGDLGWLKLNQISGYASGKRNLLENEIAWTGEGRKKEFIIRPSDGAILTPVAEGDSILNARATGNIWNMANNPVDFIKDNLNLDSVNIPNNMSNHGNYVQNLKEVIFNFPNVKNYEEMLSALQKDKNFENLIMAMGFNQLTGGSSLAKNKAIRH